MTTRTSERTDVAPPGAAREEARRRARTGPPDPRAAVAALLATGVLAGLVGLDGPTSLRLPLALVAVLLLPGVSIVGLLGLPRSAARAALTVAVSLSVAAIVSEALVLTDRLTAGSSAAALLAVSAPFVVAQVVLARRGPRGERTADGFGAHLSMLRDRSHRTPLLLTCLAIACAVVAAVVLEPHQAGRAGLISALPIVWWLGLAALTIGFVVHLRSGPRNALAVLQVGTLVALLYAVVTVAEPFARIPTSYTHVGLVDYMVRDNGITSFFDARYSWPGSLATGAMLTQLADAASSAALVKWALPGFVLLWSLAVYALASAYTTSRRVPWLAVWAFLTLNWVGQDYWSSQAVGFFLVTTVVAAVATWFPRRVLRARVRFLPYAQPPTTFTTSAQGVGLLLAIVVITVAVASSHQLSPFMLVGFLVALWLFDRRDIRLLPALAAVICLVWISWGAETYWIGHLQRLTQNVGQVSDVVADGTVDRAADGSFGRRLVLATRVALSGLVWAAAGLWLLHAIRRGRSGFVALGALAAVPLGSIALQSYGGELGLRIFLFSLPFVALLLADALDAAIVRSWSARRAGAAGAVVLVVTAAFVVARYGNERFEQTYPEDVAVVEAFAATAPPGAFVFGNNTSNPFRMLPYHDYRPRKLAALAHPEDTPTEDALRATGARRGYVIVFESGIQESMLRFGAEEGWEVELDRQLDGIGADELFRDGRAALYRYSLTGVEPLAEAEPYDRPYVTEGTRTLLARPALAASIAAALLLLVASVLHIAGVRWRPGTLDAVALAGAAGVVALVAGRFVILT